MLRWRLVRRPAAPEDSRCDRQSEMQTGQRSLASPAKTLEHWFA